MSASPHNKPSDKDLLISIENGDVASYALLKQRHGSRIAHLIQHRLAAKGCISPSNDAPIVIEETWEQIYQKAGQVQGAFESWSAVVASNQVNAHLKKCLKEKDHTRQLDDELPVANYIDFITAYEAHNIVVRAFEEAAKISPQFGILFEMRWKHGKDFKEIAASIGMKPAAARAAYCRGLNELKQRLGLS